MRGGGNYRYEPLLTSDEDDFRGKENVRAGRDRTGEFQSALRSLQGKSQVRQGQGPGSQQAQFNRGVLAPRNRNLQEYSEFMAIARYKLRVYTIANKMSSVILSAFILSIKINYSC